MPPDDSVIAGWHCTMKTSTAKTGRQLIIRCFVFLIQDTPIKGTALLSVQGTTELINFCEVIPIACSDPPA